MGGSPALGVRRQTFGHPLPFTNKAIAVCGKALKASVGTEVIRPTAIVLVRLGVAEIELLSANGVFDPDHLAAPSVEHHARNVEARIGMQDLAGDRSCIVARK